MDHLEMPGGTAVLLAPQSMQLYGLDFGRTRARAELRLSDRRQAELSVLNATVAFEAPPASGEAMSTFEASPPESIEEFRRETRDSLTADMRGELLSYDAESIARRPQLALPIRQEQAPNPSSRVTLGRARDALGVPQARFDWQLTPLDRHTMRETYLALGRELGRCGAGRVRLRDWLARDDGGWPTMVSGGWHDIGGTRMHDDPRQGVVDANCRVHGLANLHLAGAGVFSTSGAANPTLTIVALALRLADRLQAARP
jgi:choline dehydrogenase-like flavoprotein